MFVFVSNLREILFRKANILNCLQITAKQRTVAAKRYLQTFSLKQRTSIKSLQKEEKESTCNIFVYVLASTLSQYKQIMCQIMHLLSRKKSRIRTGSIRILDISFLQICLTNRGKNPVRKFREKLCNIFGEKTPICDYSRFKSNALNRSNDRDCAPI